MTEAPPGLSLVVPALAGLLLGGLYFGGLWAVVRRLDRARRPGLWLLASAVVRVAALLPILYLVMEGRPERLVAALVGFLGARLALTRLLGPVRPARPRGQGGEGRC